MSDLDRAREILVNGGFTCVLCKGERLYTSGEKGVAPMLDMLASGAELNGFAAADKVVGKAVAMLFVCAGVTEIFAQTMSKPAAEFLDNRGVKYCYEQLTEKIINRKGDGVCPMEQAVAEIDDEWLGKAAIEKRLSELRKE